MEPTDKNLTKKAYHAPQIQDYGNIKAITSAVGTRGDFDGGAPPNQKSQL
jgi:hypothetical protein